VNEAETMTEPTVACAGCGHPMPAERQVLGFDCCSGCTPQDKPLGHMVYDEKAGGFLELVEAPLFRRIKKYEAKAESVGGFNVLEKQVKKY